MGGPKEEALGFWKVNVTAERETACDVKGYKKNFFFKGKAQSLPLSRGHGLAASAPPENLLEFQNLGAQTQ